jgi:DnaK suppressor protein
MTNPISDNRVADQVADQGAVPVSDAASPVDPSRAKLDALEALKRRLHEDVANLQKTDSDRTPYGGDFESLVTAAQLASQQETDELLRRRLERRLSEIEKVSRRVEQGQYGVCESCGSEIPAERLAAVPDTTLCVRCQSNRERRGGTRRAA